MRVNRIYLFKVPFDNTYKNVFDFKNPSNTLTRFNKDFHDFLIGNFEYLEIPLDTVKSLKEINGNSIFTVPLIYTDIKSYNYCEISRGSSGSITSLRTFYFITDVQSENDSAGNPSSSINIEFDVWHNNLFELQNTNNFDENFVVKCHQNRFVSSGNVLKRTYSPTLEDFGDIKTRRSFVEFKYKVLWLKLQFDDGVTLKNFGEFAEDATSAIPFISNTPITYLPYCFIENGNLIPFKFSSRYSVTYLNDLIPTTYPSAKFLSKLTKILSNTHLINAQLTYLVPFEFSIETIQDTTYVILEDDSFYGVCTIGNPLNGWNVNGNLYHFACGYNDIIREDDVNEPFNYKDVFYLRENSIISSSNRELILNPNIEYQRMGESKFFNFPFNYSSFVINDVEKNLICSNLIDYLGLIIEKNCSMTPTLSFIENGVINETQIFINENGQCILNKDALAEYLRNNSATLITNTLINSINNISTSFSGEKRQNFLLGLSDNTNFKETNVNKKEIGGNLLNVGAGLFDLSRRRDIISQPQFIAQNDIVFQNNVRVYRNEIFSPELINTIFYSFMRYGYTLNSNRSLRKQNRYWYDFVQTRDCTLPFIKNLDERSKIQSIYNSGVTKWHISNNTAKIDFDFTINNPEIEFTTVVENKLSTPENVSISLNTLRWNYVENAEYYKIYFNGGLVLTTKATFANLVGIIPPNNTGYITIIATADGYIDSFSSEPVEYTNISTKLSTPSLLTDGILRIDPNSQRLIVEILERNGEWRQILTKETNGNTVALEVRDITFEMSFEEWGSDEVFSSVRVRTSAIGYTPSDYYTYIDEFDFVWIDNVYNLQGCSLADYYQDDFRYNKRKIPSISSRVDVTISPDRGTTLESSSFKFTDVNGDNFIDTQPIFELSNNVYLFRFTYTTNTLGTARTSIYYEA